MIIYRTTNLINGKFYVGLDTKNDPNYLRSGLLLKKAITKYGRDQFRKEILEECKTLEELREREIFWINELSAQNPEIGYNVADGGLGGDTFTNKGKVHKIIECPYCGKTGGKPAMERWHFKNCKKYKDE